MSIFNSLFGGSEGDKAPQKINWINLTQIQQLESVAETSFEKPVLIFKHSTRCAISRMSLKQFEKEFDLQDKVTPYFLDLLLHRDISDGIATRFNIGHESPQLLLIKSGKCPYHASHQDIDAGALASVL